MAKRNDRLRVVFDTNLVVRHFISGRKRKKDNFNRRIFELWLRGDGIQLIVSREIVEEYLVALRRIFDFDDVLLEQWRERFLRHRVEVVSSGKRMVASRDPKDNMFLAAATTGKAAFLVSNDYDLLDISDADKRKLKFRIVTPQEFLELWEKLS